MRDFSWMTLEQLGQIKVITASKNLQTAWTTPSALTVITDEELRLSGVSSLPQALKLAPGADVAQINAQRYAVSIRGFNSEYANKLLVLQDGRSLYTPQFLGVFWDAQDTSLEDVDRIEIVRGPGGTAWGVNAVDGVVNILTKDARDTQGAFVSTGGGTIEQAFATVRYGGAVGAHTHYRVYAKSFARGETELANGVGAGDDWHQDRAGFRVDSTLAGSSRLTFQGDYYAGRLLQYTKGAPELFRSTGANVLGRLAAQWPGGSALTLLSYVDVVRRRSSPATADSDTFAIEASHEFRPAPRHRFSWLGSFQHIRNEAIGGVGHNYDPAVRRLRQMSLSLADEFTAIKDRLFLSAGAKAEYHPFLGWETLPTARLTWTPSVQSTGWLAVSRGLQTPSISDYDLTHDIPGAVRVISLPNRNRPPGEVIATEAGWRVEPHRSLTLDVTAFHNRYDNIASANTTFDPRTSTMTLIPANDHFGESHGVELATMWEPWRSWRLRGSYSWLRMNLDARAGSTDVASLVRKEESSPRHQWQLMSMANLGRVWDWTMWLRYSSERSGLTMPAYLGLDARLAYRATAEIEVSMVGKDLLDSRHPEFTRSTGFPAVSEIPRSVYLEVRWAR